MRLGIGSASPRLLKSRTSCTRISIFLFPKKAGRSRLLVLGGWPCARRSRRHSMPLGWGSLCRCEPGVQIVLSRKNEPPYVRRKRLVAGRVNSFCARKISTWSGNNSHQKLYVKRKKAEPEPPRTLRCREALVDVEFV